MSVWKVLIAPEFGADLREIHAYISGTLLEPATAKSLTDRILRAVQSLSEDRKSVV